MRTDRIYRSSAARATCDLPHVLQSGRTDDDSSLLYFPAEKLNDRRIRRSRQFGRQSVHQARADSRKYGKITPAISTFRARRRGLRGRASEHFQSL